MRRAWALLAALAAACGSGAGSDTEDLCPAPAWQALRGDLDRSALSVWGSSDDNVVVVGGALGAPGGALAMHWDGRKWTDLATGSSETLWWVWGAPGGTTDVWMVGENGTILRWDGQQVTAMPSGTRAHLYGVWGTSSSDVWIVGGRPGPDESPDDVILHWDGSRFTAEAIEPRDAALFKVWGTGGGDIWVSGEAGTLWHKTAASWIDESPQVDTFDTLATVHGCSASEVYTVGGQNVYRWDGARWGRVEEARPLGIAAGVSCGAAGVLVVGSGGLKLRFDRATSQWIDETLAKPYETDFHGAWVSPNGAFWAVGGNYIAPASQVDHRIGVMAFRGCRAPR